MKDHVLRRFYALCAAFVMLFSSIPVPAAAEGAGSTAPVCGLEEHRHTEECRQEDVLTCGKEEHVHTDDCYPATEPEPEPAPETNEEAEEPAEEKPAEEPEQPSEPAAPEAPAQPAAPAEPETPAEPAAPAEPAQPEEPEEPVQPEKPEEPETPEEPAEPTDPEEPGEPAEPAETEAPAESDKPEASETPAAPSETEKPKATAKPEKTKAPEPVPEEKEEPVHFESGYVLIKSKTTAYTDIYQTAEKGTFIGYATAWAVSAQKATDPEQDWLQVTFDTEDAKAAGSSLLTGYIQASSVNALTEEEAQQLAAELEADPTVRKTGTHPVPVVGFELKEEPAAELTVEEVADPIAGPAEVPAETSEEEPEQEPAAEPDEDPAEPAGEPEEGLTDDPEGEPTGEPAEEPEEGSEDGNEEPGEETGENPEEGTEDEIGEEPEEGSEDGNTEPGEETEENPEEAEDENGEETEVNPEEETEDEPEEPTEVTLSSEDAPYLVVLSFLSDAGIPEGTELVVTEADGESAAPAADSIAPQKNAKKSMKMLSGSRNAKAAPAETRVSIPSLVSWSDGEEAPELILYRKTLDISLFADGEEIEPEEGTAVTVAVTLPGIEAGQDVEVVHMTKDGPVTLESTNDGGTVTFVTDSFSLFTFTSRARQIASMRTGLAETNFYGKTADRTIGPSTVALTDVTEGLEVLETCALPQDADLWTVLRMTGVPELGKAESLTLYAVNGNALGGIVQENLAPYGNLRFNLGDMNSWALVKDTGYRHLEMDMENVALDGMMPKNASATAEDVTDAYPADPAEGKTIAAYDISILDGGEKVQPEKGPITVTIRDEEIALAQAEGRTLELRHIRDDGTAEEITNFRIEGDAIIFEATGFSVYTVIDHEDGTVVTPRVEFHFISNQDIEEHNSGNASAYYAGEAYTFRNKAGDDQKTQILKDGESLELITDPGNEASKFFYGWYVVDPYVISGTTDEYGIGTSDSKLYYQWPAMPKGITFETPISITESNIEIGTEVHWSLGDASGSGEVDGDGNVHVFLAPLYENYNFVNFMLHPRGANVQGASNVMTRKMIALGSSTSEDVKISDIRSMTTDSVHLIFTGWEYNRGTDSNPDWVQIQTVDYTGAEMKDAGRDGVYLDAEGLAEGSHIDLYPIFIQARWADFFAGVTGSGASFVGSRFLESWGRDSIPAGMTETPDKNVFEQVPVSTRRGYSFEGWYALAVTDEHTGEILNLETAMPVTVKYIDNNLTEQDATITTKAIKITDGDGTVCTDGFSNDFNGVFTAEGYKLFEIDTGSGTPQLKFFDPMVRLQLSANWTPDDTKITIIYWTENAEDANYTASAAKEVYTSDLSAGLGRTFASGSTVMLADLKAYTDADYHVGIVSRDILDDVGAVPATPEQDPNSSERIEAREEIFYDLNETLSDTDKVIDGQGGTTFNVYFKRKIFKLVFHIGRDHYVKNAGRQREPRTNWLEAMYNDAAVTALLGYAGTGSASYYGYGTMTYNNVTYDSDYVTTLDNIKNDYVPDPDDPNDRNLYIIEAKYGAYIGDRWPSPVNSSFAFNTVTSGGKVKTPYIWTAHYDSLYYRNSTKRAAPGNGSGNNPDINGVHNYMSADLCADQTGTQLINENQVHHMVAYYGEASNQNRYKKYHFLKEVVDGVDIPEDAETKPGTDYSVYLRTEWSIAFAETGVILPHSYYESEDESPVAVISNLEPKFQLGPEIEGFTQVYSCYDDEMHPDGGNPPKLESHIYFFYTPKQYTLTFMYEDAEDRKTDTYYYQESLASAKKYDDPEKEGYRFLGWYTNEAGAGEPFDFAHEKMTDNGLVLYPVFEKLSYVVKIDPNGGEIDHWRPDESTSTAASTGFRTNYKETIIPYNFLKRNYLPTNDAEISQLGLNPATGVYYYMNAQYISEEHDGNFIPNKLRNALYLTEAQIDEYWEFYSDVPEEQFTERQAIKITDKDEWMTAYFGSSDISSLPKYREKRGAENYIFMGWYQVFEDGTVASAPFNFNTLVTENIELRALWRLDGGYYIQYNPYFYAEDDQGNVTAVIGDITDWTDPEDTSAQLYADQTPTHILHAPTNITEGWVFRGWRVVRKNGTKEYTDGGNTITYINWEPIEIDPSTREPVYYQPGNRFTIDSALMSENLANGTGAIIHMQAYYEPGETTARRPEVTNLILDSNDEYHGYVNTTDSGSLPELDGRGESVINKESELYDGHPTQILFGDFQSNLALHLYRYATTEPYSSGTGTNFFENDNGYLLIGFDGNTDPENPTTGEAFIPAYASDAVITVTRNETDKILYAMWEPMVYVNFVNTTEKEIKVDLSGTGTNTVHVVNIATGKFDREQSTGTIIIPAKAGNENGMVRIVLPRATPGTDSIIATALNEHPRRRITVSGEYPEKTPYGTGSTDIIYGGSATYTGTLVTDAKGITVTYTEKIDAQLVYDVNGGDWTDTEPYMHLSGDIYALEVRDISGNAYEPTDPVHPANGTRPERIFIGWTDNPDIAAVHDFSSTEEVTFGSTTITPDADGIVLDKIRSDYLWDFSRDPAELYEEEKTLYAVWSDVVTVKFNISYMDNPLKLHTWTGPETTDEAGQYVFYRESETSPYITYTLAKGEYVLMPEDPTPNSEKPGWNFIKWLKYNDTTKKYRNTAEDKANNNLNIHAFDFSQRITTDNEVSTSWTTKPSQTFTFLVENEVVSGDPNDEFIYTIAVPSVQFVAKKNGNNTVLPPDDDKVWGSVSTTLKSGEQYTVRVTVFTMTDGWTGYNTVVDVFDKDGILVKTGKLTRRTGQSRDGFTSDYKYTLTISQEPKAGYETEVAIGDQSEYGTVENPQINNDPNAPDYSFSFYSCMFNSTNVTGSLYALYSSTFTPEQNRYDLNNLTNGLTIVFTNTGAGVVAPTGITLIRTPFILMMLTGLLLAGFAVPGCLRKRRRAREDIGTEGRIPDPETTKPGPRLKLLIQPRGPSRKRGGSG